MKVELIGKHEKDSRACRDAMALTLKDMMAKDTNICYVDCDLMGCVNTKQLLAAYPDRTYEAGIAEANAAGVDELVGQHHVTLIQLELLRHLSEGLEFIYRRCEDDLAFVSHQAGRECIHCHDFSLLLYFVFGQ